jgi:type I restriction enzyme S subunit
MTKLPDGWEIKRLDEIADIVMGQSPPGSSYNEHGEGQPFFQGKTEFGEVHPTVRKYTTAGTKFAKAGDILMSVRAPVGPTNIADIDCVIGRGLAAIRAKTVVSQDYLRWSLKHLEIDIQSKGTGTTFDAITGETLRGTLVALPPIDEQHKIVEILEDHLSRLDAALADVKQAKVKAAQFRRSLLQAAFTGNLGLDDTNSLTEWRTKTVGEIADTQLGKMLNKGKQTGENTIPYLRSVNVQWGRVDTSDLNQMDILPNELEKFTVKKGDLLICEGGESGRVAIWDRDEPIGFQNALHRVRAKAEVSNKYLYYYFEWLVKNQLIEHLFNGVTIKHFPQENLRSVEVSYPPVDEQDKIVELLEDHLSRLDASVSLADAMQKQSNGLRRSLLQAAFTGQLTKGVVSV